MKLNVKALALAAGILWGVLVFVLTMSDLWRGSGAHLGMLSGVYFGYKISYLGAVVGLAYGFVTGLIGGAVLAWLYNRLARQA